MEKADKTEFNAIPLQQAVLCAECEIISDSPSDVCRVCGSPSLVNLSCILGGLLPAQRARLVEVGRGSRYSATEKVEAGAQPQLVEVASEPRLIEAAAQPRGEAGSLFTLTCPGEGKRRPRRRSLSRESTRSTAISD